MALGDRVKNGLGSVKTRSLLVVVIVIIIIVGIVMWTALRDTTGVLGGGSNVKHVKPIASLPGAGEASPVYNPLQEQQNKENAETAKTTGGSAVPSLLNPNDENYGRQGFGELNDNTGRCGDECYDQSGYDQQGYDKSGFDKNGFDKNGYDKDGYDKDGFDRQGYDRDGFDRKGCNRQGMNREGKPCAESVFGSDCFNAVGKDKNGCNREGKDDKGAACYDAQGYNTAGFNKCGLNTHGLDAHGRDCNACDANGMDAKGQACYDASGFNSKGLNRFCRDKDGFDASGYDKDGFDRNGFDKDGFDKNGFDKNGCNREGKNRAGRPCYNAKGLTDEGFDRAGYDKNGFDRNGLDRQGFNKDGLSPDGFDRLGFNKDGCNKEGKNRQGKPCNGEPDLGNLLSSNAEGNTPVTAQSQANAQLERLLAEQRAQEAARMAALTAQQQQDLAAQQQAQINANAALMNTQAQQLIAAWTPPKQNFVKGNHKEQKPVATEAKKSNSTLPEKGTGPLIYKVGDVAFGIIETSINSDEPGPVMARIVSGPLKGSRVLGNFERQGQKVMLTFTSLNMPNVPESIDIDAVAIDPDTARTALASDVDNHYLTKYASMAAASFLQGMGQAVETSIGTPQLSSSGSATIASTLPADTRDQVIVGLGKAGQAIATDINKSDIQPTVTVDSGTAIGLLIMSDLRIEQPAEKTQTAKTPAATQQAANGAPTINVTVQSPGGTTTTPATIPGTPSNTTAGGAAANNGATLGAPLSPTTGNAQTTSRTDL